MAERGRQIYAANGCVYCHSQQVRADYAGSDIERKWGVRRSAPRDYLYERPVVLGKMRLGPDLSNIGKRAPVEEETAPAAASPAPAGATAPQPSPATSPAPGASPAARLPFGSGFTGKRRRDNIARSFSNCGGGYCGQRRFNRREQYRAATVFRCVASSSPL